MAQSRPAARGWLRLVPGQKAAPVPVPLADEVLMDAIARGERGVGDELYVRLIRIVDSTLYRVLGPGDADHDDLVQMAFEQIVTTIARRKFARACSLSSWAAAVTCNLALNALRARISERRVFDRGIDLTATDRASDAPDLERQLDARRELERVRSHLARMTPERAETLLLHDMQGLELSEIAVLTGVSVAAAQSRLVRGRGELLRRIEAADHYTPEEPSP